MKDMNSGSELQLAIIETCLPVPDTPACACRTQTGQTGRSLPPFIQPFCKRPLFVFLYLMLCFQNMSNLLSSFVILLEDAVRGKDGSGIARETFARFQQISFKNRI